MKGFAKRGAFFLVFFILSCEDNKRKDVNECFVFG